MPARTSPRGRASGAKNSSTSHNGPAHSRLPGNRWILTIRFGEAHSALEHNAPPLPSRHGNAAFREEWWISAELDNVHVSPAAEGRGGQLPVPPNDGPGPNPCMMRGPESQGHVVI